MKCHKILLLFKMVNRICHLGWQVVQGLGYNRMNLDELFSLFSIQNLHQHVLCFETAGLSG